MKYKASDFQVKELGARRIDACAIEGMKRLDGDGFWISDLARVPLHLTFEEGGTIDRKCAFEKAGPRREIFFDPAKVTAGVVTCGGICPGLNDVVRSLFMELHHVYGVPRVLGFRYGMRGLDPSSGLKPVALTHQNVVDMHARGGTLLGTSRGKVDLEIAVSYLQELGVNILFMIGGDGSQSAAHEIWKVIDRRGLELAVVGIPKTIDNDIMFVHKTFGFDTAVSKAKEVLDCAHVEATGHPNGIGLVKLMGRDSGFIAAFAALASLNVNFLMIPEVPFDLNGSNGLLAHLEKRLERSNHALIVVAEGAGQELLEGNREIDPSGNVKHADIGSFLKRHITDYFHSKKIEINLKYFNPSYLIRSLPSNAYDSIYAATLARFAVHAGMAGKTDIMIGRRFDAYIHVPIPLAVSGRKKINPNGQIWLSVLQATGQPHNMCNSTR